MGDMAVLTFTGRLTRAATSTPLDSNPNVHVLKFSVASSYYDFKKRDRTPVFYEVRIVGPGQRIEKKLQFLSKGAPVFVTGKFQPRTDENGKVWMNVEDAEFEPQGPPNKEGGQNSGGQGGGYGGEQTSAQPPAGYEPPADTLPAGWRKEHDPQSGRDFYVGPDGTSQWERPKAKPPGPPAGPPAGPPSYPSSKPPGAPV